MTKSDGSEAISWKIGPFVCQTSTLPLTHAPAATSSFFFFVHSQNENLHIGLHVLTHHPPVPAVQTTHLPRPGKRELTTGKVLKAFLPWCPHHCLPSEKLLSCSNASTLLRIHATEAGAGPLMCPLLPYRRDNHHPEKLWGTLGSLQGKGVQKAGDYSGEAQGPRRHTGSLFQCSTWDVLT